MFRSTYRFVHSALLMTKNWVLNQFDPPVIILIYHRVTTLVSDPQLLVVAPENFRAHMKFLKGNFPVLRLEDDWSNVKETAVAVTFDDGYADNALEALPILEEVGVPATFFVSTGTIGAHQEFWWDELERIILGEWTFPVFFGLQDSQFGRGWSTVTAAERYSLYQEIHLLMKKVDAARRESWLQQLREWAQVDEAGRLANRSMTVDELCSLARSQWVTIGAHTVTHTQLATLPYKKQREEIVGSKEQLEACLGREVKVFSYPFGAKSDYNRDSVRLCEEAGFTKVVSNFPGQVHRWTNPYQIPRQLVRNWSLDEFVKKISGFWIL